MILPNAILKRSDLIDLVTAANLATPIKLPRGPFGLFNPKDDAVGGMYFDLPAPYTVTDRGAWAAGTYNAGDQVTCDGYIFISVINGNTVRPLNATTGMPASAAQWRMPWQSCYQRIRDEVNRSANTPGLLSVEIWLEQFRQAVSGPWPCQTPNINYDQLAFYFEDTGDAESVTIAKTGGTQCNGKFTLVTEEVLTGYFVGSVEADRFPVAQLDVDGSDPTRYEALVGPSTGPDPVGTDPGGQFHFQYATGSEISIIIGGTVPIHISATFEIVFTAYKGWGVRLQDYGDGALSIGTAPVTDSDDPLTLFTVDTANWLPGASFTAAFLGWSGATGFQKQSGSIRLTCTVDDTFDPGVYTVSLAATRGPNNSASGIISAYGGGTSFTGYNEWKYNTFVVVSNRMAVEGSFTIVADTAVETPGIDDHVRILKIALPEFNGVTRVPTGLYSEQAYYRFYVPTESRYITTPLEAGNWYFWKDETPPAISVDPTFIKDYWQEGMLSTTITASTTGYWLGVTPPVRSLGMIPYDKMPWNQFPVTFPASGANTATDNKYLGYTLPYMHGRNFDGSNSERAYNFTDSPGWLTLSDAVELLPMPKAWKAQTHYPAGFTIIDTNGNLQTAQTSARSGTTQPTWPTAEGDLTNEPGYTDLSGAHAGVRWKLIKQLRPPPSILRSTVYAVGESGVDDNGNDQQCTVSGAGGLPGPTGSTKPTWATTVGATTVDGTVTWRLTRVNARLNPAVVKISPPIYPFFWHNPVSQWERKDWGVGDEISDRSGNTQRVVTAGTSGLVEPVAWGSTLNALTTDGTVQWRCIRLEKPDLTDPNVQPASGGLHPFSFAPQGWWIYRVFLNRIPQKKSREKPDSTPIEVKLGCVRSGAFVSFGTYHTGTPVDAMWPVFTNTHLAYEAAERIDVQAEILTCGLSYSTWGVVAHPVAAAFINDVTTILGLL